MGYAGLGVQGCRDIPTPNMDSIARGGVRFTQGYVSCPLCSPTRAGLMTGRYGQRFGYEMNPGPAAVADDKFGLPLAEKTLAERMKDLGYRTGMFGKWHLGFKPEMTPPKRGFDEFFGFLDGAHEYLPGRRAGRILRGMDPVEEKEYLTEALAREAVSFIERHKDEPFFLYVPFNAVHAPMQSVQKYLDRFPDITDANRRIHAAMTAALDDAVGRVLQTLRRLDLEQDTLIFFFSDNGGPTAQTTSSNAPFRGFKGQVWEGGIHIPFMMQWKDHLPAGRVDERPVIQLDILPTALAAAGAEIQPEWKLDGANLLPFLSGANPGRPHEALYWRMGRQQAVRSGDWKLVRGVPRRPDGRGWTLQCDDRSRRSRKPGGRHARQGQRAGRPVAGLEQGIGGAVVGAAGTRRRRNRRPAGSRRSRFPAGSIPQAGSQQRRQADAGGSQSARAVQAAGFERRRRRHPAGGPAGLARPHSLTPYPTRELSGSLASRGLRLGGLCNCLSELEVFDHRGRMLPM